MTFNDIMQIVQVLLVPMLGYAAYVLRDIDKQLRNLNGRIIKIEEWKTGHEKLDDVRFEELKHLDKAKDK